MEGIAGGRVLITAGAAGIGRVVADRFMRTGATVWICDIDETALAAAEAALPSIRASRADVAEPEAIGRLFDAIEQDWGRLDVLVNNAGTAGPTGPVESLEYGDWRRCVAVNLDGAFLCVRRAVPLLERAGGGCIVNMSSTAGLLGYPFRTPYAAAKWAVIGFTKSLAMELGPRGIRVNAICPGAVMGERIDRVIRAEAASRGVPEPAVREGYARSTSLRTFIAPEDIAGMILFLCSDEGAKITGQAIAVDGHTETLRPIE
jgi:NAD(P)-dependent dehydrogenase (short-subunit alcohol dehydrogenase family)